MASPEQNPTRTGLSRQFDIVAVDDSAADLYLIEAGLEASGCPHKLTKLMDGETALQTIRGRTERSAKLPDFILLDWNLPKKSGNEILRELKSDPALSRIPVVVLTSSSAAADVDTAYRLHANAYVKKPLELDAFFFAIAEVCRFWTQTAQLSVADPSARPS